VNPLQLANRLTRFAVDASRWGCRIALLMATVWLCIAPGSLRGQPIALRSGALLTGEVVRVEGEHVSIRTATGVSRYALNELDQEWVEANVLSRPPRPETDIRWGLALAAMLVISGLVLCFFGWHLFRFFTILGGILTGIIIGLTLGWLIANAVASRLAGGLPREGLILVTLLAGLPLALLTARMAPRLALFNARSRSLNRLGRGWRTSALALGHFVFFDYVIAWTHAIMGMIMIVIGLIYGTSLVSPRWQDDLPDWALWGVIGVAAIPAVAGAIQQSIRLGAMTRRNRSMR